MQFSERNASRLYKLCLLLRFIPLHAPSVHLRTCNLRLHVHTCTPLHSVAHVHTFGVQRSATVCTCARVHVCNGVHNARAKRVVQPVHTVALRCTPKVCTSARVHRLHMHALSQDRRIYKDKRITSFDCESYSVNFSLFSFYSVSEWMLKKSMSYNFVYIFFTGLNLQGLISSKVY